MPYVPQFLAQWGLGPADIRGGRPELVGRTALVVITVVVAFASIVAAAFIARSVVSPTAEGATGARLVATILAGQALGVVPPSLHFQYPVPAAILNTTLDRYLLPLLPLALCLAVCGVAAMRVPPWPAWG